MCKGNIGIELYYKGSKELLGVNVFSTPESGKIYDVVLIHFYEKKLYVCNFFYKDFLSYLSKPPSC